MAGIDRVNHIPYEEHDNVRGECEPDGGFVPPYDSGCNRGYTEYKNFANRWSWSVCLLSASLVIICLIYAFMSNTSFRDHNGKNSPELLLVWWRAARWPTMYATLAGTLGIIFSFIAIPPIIALMMPRLVERTYNVFPFPPWIFTHFGYISDIKAHYTIMYGIFGVMPMAWTVGMMSLGLYRKTKVYVNLQGGGSKQQVIPNTPADEVEETPLVDGPTSQDTGSTTACLREAATLDKLLEAQCRTNKLLEMLVSRQNEVNRGVGSRATNAEKVNPGDPPAGGQAGGS